jgi:hypothetical protein
MPKVASVTVAPLNDNFLDSVWTTDVRRNVDRALKNAMCIDGEEGKIALFGHNKDESSYYLGEFPEWDVVEVPNVRDLNATDIRRNLFDIFRPTDHTFMTRIAKYCKRHMPMIAEAHITLLACARIGAIHSVVFGVLLRLSSVVTSQSSVRLLRLSLSTVFL